MAQSLARKKGIIVEETDLWDGSVGCYEASRWDAMNCWRDVEPTDAPWAAMKRRVKGCASRDFARWDGSQKELGF